MKCCIDGLVDSVSCLCEGRADPFALAVEQNRVLERRREDSAFLETDNKDERAASKGCGREGRDVEVSGTRAVGSNMKALDTLAEEAQRLVEGTTERAEGPEFADRFGKRLRSHCI